ncbi:DUF2341 domain-containing protein, partial [Candidatus Berkelbacteria bacterium]|nr:DUF2341 domain-containing protein [Candidatus Berkelbacteria bacterium]
MPQPSEPVETLIHWLDPHHQALTRRFWWYARWHAHPHAKRVHIGLGLGVLAFALVKIALVASFLLPSAGEAATTWTETTQAHFAAGTASSTTVTNTAGGEVTLQGYTYTKKRAITVTNNTAGTLTNYQVRLDLTSSNFTFTDTQADGDDIRFLSSDDSTQLDYWTEVWNNGAQTATVWVEVPSIPASSTATVNMYYANASAPSGSSASTTFVRSITNLDGAWTFDEGTGSTVADASGDNNTGTITNATFTTGKFGQALNFDGDGDYVTVANESNFDYERTQAFSLEAWMKYVDDNTDHFWISKQRSQDSYKGFGITSSGSRDDWGGFIQTSGSDYAYSGSTTTLSTDWQHLVFTYDGSSSTNGFRLYLNGNPETIENLDTLGNIASGSTLNDGALMFGARGGAEVPAKGVLDEVRVYNKALSAAEVTDLAANYAYATTNSANTILVRKRATTEPSVSVGSGSTVSQGVYPSSATFTSQAYDTAQFSDFGSLAWNATTPTGTAVKFQVRSADTSAALSSATWYGPTGTGDYYTSTGTTTNATHDGNIWVQYRATLETTDPDSTPTLNSVSLTYDVANKTYSSNTSLAEGTYTMNNLTINTAATLTLAGNTTVNVLGALDIDDAGGASKIVCQGKNTSAASGGVGCTINVTGNATVDASSLIDADAQGYAAGTSTAATGKGPGAGAGGTNRGGGAGHGGVGGAGDPNGGGAGGPVYDDPIAPTDLGSGGGGGNSVGPSGGAGGGAVRLAVTGTLTLNGGITADGAASAGSCGGGGAGGSVYVTTGTLAGSGTMTATGGNSAGNCGGSTAGMAGGGGGRIAVYYNTNSAFGGFTTSVVTAGTGTSPGQNGSVGTAAFFDADTMSAPTTDTARDLYVYTNFAYETAGASISLDNVTVGTSGVAGATLTLAGNTTLTIGGSLAVTDGTSGSSLVCLSTNTTAASGGRGCTLSVAGSTTIATNSSISADQKGYTAGASQDANGNGPGGGDGGTGRGGGGGHGGAGGTGGTGPGTGGTTYDDGLAPTDLGSGGGGGNVVGPTGGAGGGAVRLTTTGTLTVNGTITADGGNETGGCGGGGAGGSVYVTTGTLAGSAGTLTASGGGAGANTCGGASTHKAGGGGGRIAVYYTTLGDFNVANISVAGGAGTASGTNGSNGTQFSIANGHFTVSDNYTFAENSTIAFTNMTVNNGATVTIGGGSTVTLTDTLTVTGNSTIKANGKNRTGASGGSGVVFTAAAVTIASGSSIDGDGQGYTAGTSAGVAGNGPGPGQGHANRGGGGGHGGAGGAGNALGGGAGG